MVSISSLNFNSNLTRRALCIYVPMSGILEFSVCHNFTVLASTNSVGNLELKIKM